MQKLQNKEAVRVESADTYFGGNLGDTRTLN